MPTVGPQPSRDEKKTDGGEGGEGEKNDRPEVKNLAVVTSAIDGGGQVMECGEQVMECGEQVMGKGRLDQRDRRRRLLRLVVWGYLGKLA